MNASFPNAISFKPFNCFFSFIGDNIILDYGGNGLKLKSTIHPSDIILKEFKKPNYNEGV